MPFLFGPSKQTDSQFTHPAHASISPSTLLIYYSYTHHAQFLVLGRPLAALSNSIYRVYNYIYSTVQYSTAEYYKLYTLHLCLSGHLSPEMQYNNRVYKNYVRKPKRPLYKLRWLSVIPQDRRRRLFPQSGRPAPQGVNHHRVTASRFGSSDGSMMYSPSSALHHPRRA